MKLNLSLLAALIFAILCLAGCADKLTPQTQAAIVQTRQKTAVAVAQAKSAAAVNAVNGAESPLLHPLAALNNLVVEIHPWLLAATLISFFLWATAFGLSFTQFSFLSFLAPAFKWLAAICGAALVALPALPWVVAGLAIYEIIAHRQWLLAKLGLGPAPAPVSKPV